MLKLSYFLDLFGIRGGPPSVIHVMADELQKCKAVLEVRNNVVVSYGPFPSFFIAFFSIRKNTVNCSNQRSLKTKEEKI